jgi:DNA primase
LGALSLARTIPEDVIRRIQNTANIVDIIGESVVLKKTGRNFQGLCPFHTEKTPSFSVNPEKQIFYCFGCQTGGSVFSFLMRQEGLTFPEAVRNVAARYGIDVPEQRLTPTQKKHLNEKERLFQINEMACSYFKHSLIDERRGQKAMAYLLGRGMTKAIIDGHQLGFAPGGWDGLLNYFKGKNIRRELLVKSGLIIPRKDGSGHYDRFRDRIIFPIFNISNQIIGFGGRVMGDDLPKYLNSPESPIYNKRRSLYGIQRARQSSRASKRVYLVEGYFDVLAMHLYGIENAVATLGTSLTSEHAKRLKGLVGDGEVVLVYDSDQAGIKAAQRSVAIFNNESLNARVLVLPEGEDPDSYLRNNGPDDFTKLASKALSFIPFLIESAVERFGLSPEGKVRIVSSLRDPLAELEDNVARSIYVRELAERLNIDESAILAKIEEIRGIRKKSVPSKPVNVNTDSATINRHQRLEMQLVSMMMCFPAIIDEIIGRNYLDSFESMQLKEIAQIIVERSLSGNERIAELVSTIDDPKFSSLLAKLAMTDSQWDRQDCDRLLTQFDNRLRRRKSADLQRQIKAAENNGDFELLSRLLRRKQLQAGRGMTH